MREMSRLGPHISHIAQTTTVCASWGAAHISLAQKGAHQASESRRSARAQVAGLLPPRTRVVTCDRARCRGVCIGARHGTTRHRCLGRPLVRSRSRDRGKLCGGRPRVGRSGLHHRARRPARRAGSVEAARRSPGLHVAARVGVTVAAVQRARPSDPCDSHGGREGGNRRRVLDRRLEHVPAADVDDARRRSAPTSGRHLGARHACRQSGDRSGRQGVARLQLPQLRGQTGEDGRRADDDRGRLRDSRRPSRVGDVRLAGNAGTTADRSIGSGQAPHHYCSPIPAPRCR